MCVMFLEALGNHMKGLAVISRRCLRELCKDKWINTLAGSSLGVLAAVCVCVCPVHIQLILPCCCVPQVHILLFFQSCFCCCCCCCSLSSCILIQPSFMFLSVQSCYFVVCTLGVLFLQLCSVFPSCLVVSYIITFSCVYPSCPMSIFQAFCLSTCVISPSAVLLVLQYKSCCCCRCLLQLWWLSMR